MRGDTGFDADDDDEDTELGPLLGVADMGVGPGEEVKGDGCNGDAMLLMGLLEMAVSVVLIWLDNGAVEFFRVRGTGEDAGGGVGDVWLDPGAGALGGGVDDKETPMAAGSFSSFSILSHSLRFSAHW